MHQLFLESAERLATTPDQLVAAVSTGLDGVFDQLLRQACAEVDANLEDFAAELETDEGMRAELQRRLGSLFNAEVLEKARGMATRRDLERQLHVLRYVLSGTEPAAWVWDSIDEEEAERLRSFRAAGGDEDPVVLGRVLRALQKLETPDGGFGVCEGCRKEILQDRLQLLPYAERCTRCQREVDEPGASASNGKLMDLWMFFEGGRAVPKDKQFIAAKAASAN